VSTSYLVGRGIADVTGEAADCGMLGYGKSSQVTAGLHLRLRCRSFIVAENVDQVVGQRGSTDQVVVGERRTTGPGGGKRVLIAVAELPLMFEGVRRAVLDRLAERFGTLYGDENVLLTVTHTHSGPGGYAHHRLYNTTTHGFRPRTFGAIVDGITESAVRAHEDLAPADLYLTHGELHDASSNRSPTAFARNPEPDRAAFPGQIDPQTSLLRFERDGRLTGAINWFATHGTSLTNTNRLISSDNKGYAAYHWERLVHGVDYLADPAATGFVGAFAQTNAGDMSPNLNHRPGSGPTEDEFENTRIIGLRQYEAAAALSTERAPALAGGLDYRLTHLDMSDVSVLCGGRQHRTTKPFAGAAAFAGTDEGPGFGGFRQGRNPLWDGLAGLVYRMSPRLRDGQAPKGLVVPGGLVNRLAPLVAERVPVQLIRIGPLYLLGVPGEATIVAGLRLRRAVAAVTGAELRDVLVAGYSNAYIHYITTPEEYREQRYEGGSTLFGRWELPALEQAARTLATAMRDGAAAPRGPVPPRLPTPRAAPRPARDAPGGRHTFGQELVPPAAAYRVGGTAAVTFAGAHPAHNLHRGGTYLYVERDTGQASGDQYWVAVADDGDWCTTFRWERRDGGTSAVTVTWTIPGDTAPGQYRIRYYGDAAVGTKPPHSFTGTSTPFRVDA
jgi:neutral ceramidase